MSEISVYDIVPTPKLADKLIGTSVGGVIPDVTYNFTLEELLQLFIPNLPANNLQGVLNYGNTATQNINLTGTINTTNLNVLATANILDSNFSGKTRIMAGLYDRTNSIGTAGQVLRSTGTQVEWYTVPTVIPTLQQVLQSGNTSDVSIILTANITAVTATATNVVSNTSLSVNGVLKDGTASAGGSNQILSSTGSGVQWVDLPVYNAVSPLLYNNITKTFSIQVANSTQGGYLSNADWINFDGKQDAISLTTTGTSGAATFVGNTLNIPVYTPDLSGYVPESRTLTINGVTYDLSANRSWTIAAGVASVTATVPLSSSGGANPDISITQSNSTTDGYLSSADWIAFNNKQNALDGGTGLVKSTAGTISYITDNSSNWNTAYNDSIVSAAVTGTATKTLTLNQQDGGTIQASWSDADTGLTSVGLSMPSAFTVSNSPLTSNGTIGVTGAGTTAQYVRGDGSLANFPSIVSEAQRLVTEVYNETGATLTKGTVVYINGGHGNLPTITKAIATGDATSAQTYGVVQTDITNNNNGFVVAIGGLENIDTQAYADGTQLYLSSTVAGAWTSVKQYAPAHLVYVGIVVRSHPTQGVVEIRIQNGFEMDELHNVSAQSPTNNAILQYKTSTTLWTSVDGTTTNIAEGTNLYYLDSRARAALSASAPLSYNNITGAFSISQSGASADGYLSSADWNTFNNKQVAGNYITSLTGEATGTGPGATAVTLTNSAVTAKVLTGVNITGGTVLATDTMLTAFGKLQNQINGLIGSTIYQGTWNANTNIPALASSVGTRGYYYIVNVAGTTNLNGITDWQVGDWAIYDGTAWQKVDNTDSVTSVNGFTGAVSLTTDNIAQGTTNLYFANSLARGAVSLTTTGSSGAATYNNTTGVFNIPNYGTALANYLPLAGGTLTGALVINPANSAVIGLDAASDTFRLRADSTNPFARQLTTTLGSGTLVKMQAAGYGGTYVTDLGFYTSSVSSVNSTPNLYLTGGDNRVGINTITPAYTLDVVGTAGVSGVLTLGSTISNGTYNYTLPSASGTLALTSDIPSGTISGSGTVNYVPKFTAASVIGNSNIQDSGSLITLGSITRLTGAGTFSTDTAVDTGDALMISSAGATAATGAYGSGLVFGGVGISVNPRRAAIVPVMSTTSADTDRLGLAFFTHPSATGSDPMIEMMRLDHNGSLGIGTTSLTGFNLRVSKNITGSATSYSTQNDGQIQSDVTSTAHIYRSAPSTQATAFTLSNLNHYTVFPVLVGSGSAITFQRGFWVTSLTGAAANYGFVGDIAAASNAWNIYMSGTASNYMFGNLGIGTNAITGYSLRINKNPTGATTAYGVSFEGTVQSDVTSGTYGFRTNIATFATAFTSSFIVHYAAIQGAIGAGSSVTNQYGFFVGNNLTGATNNYAFFSDVASGTNRWNLYMNGTANNYMAGSLGIGTTSIGAASLTVSKTLTGATSRYGIYQAGQVQSDVTTLAIGIYNQSNTAGAAFTLGSYVHLLMQQGTIGATSAITDQFGVFIDSTLTGATNNYGIYSSLAAGTGRWNLYFAGTAANYMAGSLYIGTTIANSSNVRVSQAITGATTWYGIRNDGRVQSDVTANVSNFASFLSTAAATFTLSEYSHYSAQQGTIGAGSAITAQYGYLVTSGLTAGSNNYGFFGNLGSASNVWNLYMNGTANNYMAGSLGIGSTSLTGTTLNVAKNLTGATSVRGISQEGFVQSDATVAVFGIRNVARTATASFTISDYQHFLAVQTTLGVGSAITNQYGFVADTTLVSGTNNFGFYGNIPAASGRWNLYMNGTAANYLAGQLGVGITSPNASAKVQIDSTTQGFLPPRMTAAQRAAITTPAEGLVVFQTDGTVGLYLYASAAWHSLTML